MEYWLENWIITWLQLDKQAVFVIIQPIIFTKLLCWYIALLLLPLSTFPCESGYGVETRVAANHPLARAGFFVGLRSKPEGSSVGQNCPLILDQVTLSKSRKEANFINVTVSILRRDVVLCVYRNQAFAAWKLVNPHRSLTCRREIFFNLPSIALCEGGALKEMLSPCV